MDFNIRNLNFLEKKNFQIKKQKTKIFKIMTDANSVILPKKFSFVGRFNSHSIEKDVLMMFYTKFFPENISLEFEKARKKTTEERIKKILFQFPEGLNYFFPILSKVLKNSSRCIFSSFNVSKATYGACCIEDTLGEFLGCEILFHYGHSCLVPVNESSIISFYYFVEIIFDLSYLFESIIDFFLGNKIRSALISTIQFSHCLDKINSRLEPYFHLLQIPREKPLSKGEVLGCTSKKSKGQTNFIYIGDGRFHIEGSILSNFKSRFIQFDPHSQSFFIIDFFKSKTVLKSNTLKFNSRLSGKNFILISSTLGKQGNKSVFNKIEENMKSKNIPNNPYYCGEILTNKVPNFKKSPYSIIQLACPRLSIDWSSSYRTNLIGPKDIWSYISGEENSLSHFKMDFYSGQGTALTCYYKSNKLYFYIIINQTRALLRTCGLKIEEYERK